MRIPGIRIVRVPGLPGVGVVELQGPIDAGNVEALQILLSAPGGRAFKSVILDLEQVRYINSLGMSYLVSLTDILHRRGGALYLANPQPKVKVVLEMMGLTELFKLYASISSVIRGISGGSRPAFPEPRDRMKPSRFSATP